MEQERAAGFTGRQWAIAVLGLVVTAVVAHLLPGLLLMVLFSGLLGDDSGFLGDFVFSAGGLATIALAALSGVPFVTRLRHWWALLAGLVMTVVVYLALAVWAGAADGELGEVLPQVVTLIWFGARIGPFWLTLLVCSVGILVIRRLVRPGPAAQAPYNSTNI